MEQKKFIKIVQELAQCRIKPHTGLTVDKIIPQISVCGHCERTIDTSQRITITHRATVGWVGRCNTCATSFPWDFT